MLEADNLDTALHDFALFDPLSPLRAAGGRLRRTLQPPWSARATTTPMPRLDRLEQLRLSQSHQHRNS